MDPLDETPLPPGSHHRLSPSGMLDSLDARNRQALAEHLAPTELLTLLIQDELARRDQHKLNRRLRRAAFHSAKTIEQFDFNVLPSLNRATVHDLMTVDSSTRMLRC